MNDYFHAYLGKATIIAVVGLLVMIQAIEVNHVAIAFILLTWAVLEYAQYLNNVRVARAERKAYAAQKAEWDRMSSIFAEQVTIDEP